MTLSPAPEIQNIVDLISNTADGYTTVFFVAAEKDGPLEMVAYQSLSRHIDTAVKIGPGEGLIGWVHKNNQPVNVDQFESDTRRLMFYSNDESIKSFMAVPLPQINGVLAVDSKNRYVFTDKSHKILSQFAGFLELVYQRLQTTRLGEITAEAFDFKCRFEKALSQRLESGKSLDQAMGLLKRYAGVEACFLVAVYPGNPKQYFILAYDVTGGAVLTAEALPVESGLAGWVLQHRKPLILDRTRTPGDRGFIFYPEEQLKFYPSFIGHPLIWDGRLRGGLFLAGERAVQYEDPQLKALEAAAARLTAGVELELLFKRLSELTRLDSQTGLPHRAHFMTRMNRMIKVAAIKHEPIIVLLVEVLGLEECAAEIGQDAVQEALKIIVHEMLEKYPQKAEVGHLSYGMIALALPGRDDSEVLETSKKIARQFSDFPLDSFEGRIKLRFRASASGFKPETMTAEAMVLKAIKQLRQHSISLFGE